MPDVADRPKVLVLFASFSDSMRRSALEVVAAAMKRYDDQIFALDRDAKIMRASGVAAKSWKPAGLLSMLWAIDELRKTVKKYDPDMIHAFGFTTAAAGLGSVSRMMASRTLVSLHDPIPLSGTELPKKFVKQKLPLLLERAGAIVCAHPTLAREIEEHLAVPADRVDVIPPSVHMVPTGAMRPKGRPGPIVGFAGQLGPDQAYVVTLAAFAKVKAEYPDAQLWLAGGGSLIGRVRGEVRELGIAESVRFMGEVGLAELFGGIDLLMVPRGRDPYPRGLLEALVCGIPVVAANRGALADYVGERETGWLVTPDADGFAAGVRDAWRHIDRAWEGAAAQSAAAAAEFDPETVVGRTLAHYEELLAANAVRA